MTKTYNIMTFGPPTKSVFQCYSRFWCFISENSTEIIQSDQLQHYDKLDNNDETIFLITILYRGIKIWFCVIYK